MSLLSSKRERKRTMNPVYPSVNKHWGGRREVGAATLLPQTLKSFPECGILPHWMGSWLLMIHIFHTWWAWNENPKILCWSNLPPSRLEAAMEDWNAGTFLWELVFSFPFLLSSLPPFLSLYCTRQGIQPTFYNTINGVSSKIVNHYGVHL